MSTTPASDFTIRPSRGMANPTPGSHKLVLWAYYVILLLLGILTVILGDEWIGFLVWVVLMLMVLSAWPILKARSRIAVTSNEICYTIAGRSGRVRRASLSRAVLVTVNPSFITRWEHVLLLVGGGEQCIAKVYVRWFSRDDMIAVTQAAGLSLEERTQPTTPQEIDAEFPGAFGAGARHPWKVGLSVAFGWCAFLVLIALAAVSSRR